MPVLGCLCADCFVSCWDPLVRTSDLEGSVRTAHRRIHTIPTAVLMIACTLCANVAAEVDITIRYACTAPEVVGSPLLL